MHKLSFFLALAAFAMSSGCKKDPDGTGNLTLRFKGKVGTEPMVLYQTKGIMPDGDTLTMQLLNFFLCDIRLVAESGDTVLVDTVEFVDFAKNHLNATTAVDGESFVIKNIPTGNYTKILLGIGVSPSLNAQDPGNFPSTSPLGDVGNYWTAWNSYIFSRVEGNVKSSAGTTPFLYHTGVDGTYQERGFTQAIEIQKDATDELVFELDAKKIFFTDAGATIDIENNQVTHSGAVGTNDYRLALDVIRNLSDALKVQ